MALGLDPIIIYGILSPDKLVDFLVCHKRESKGTLELRHAHNRQSTQQKPLRVKRNLPRWDFPLIQEQKSRLQRRRKKPKMGAFFSS
jgi:hypothetical protein